MAIPFLNHLDLRSVSELQNAILHKTTESSASNVEGKIIYDTGTNTLKYRSDSAWISLTGDTNTFRTVQVDGSAIDASETLNLIGGTNITLSETDGAVTINGAAGTTVQINNGTARSGAITLQPGSTTTSTIAVTEPNAAGIFNFDIIGGSIGTNELENGGVTLAKLDDIANNTVIGRTASGSGVPSALSKSDLLGLLNVSEFAQPNVATNITVSENASTVDINSSTGSDDSIAAATQSAAGVMTATDKTKLDGIASSATATAAPAIENSSGTPAFASGITKAEVQTLLSVENNADVTDTTNVLAALSGNLGTPTFGDSNDTITIAGNLIVSGTQTVQNETVQVVENNTIQFEGTTADANEVLLTAADATGGDKTITLPDLSGHVALLASAATATITATPAELNLMDGGATVGTTAVAAGDGFIHNDNGTMRVTSINKLADKFAGTNITASSGVLSVANSSTTAKGLIETATNTEASQGVLTSVAVTPRGLKQFNDDRKYTENVTSAITAGTTYTCTHSLGTRDVIVQIFALVEDLTTSGTNIVDQYAEVQMDVIRASTDTITFSPNINIRAILGGSLRILIKALD
jgi:hypothetical protein